MVASTACASAGGNYFAPTAAVVCGRQVDCIKISEARIGEFLTQVVQNPATATQFRGPQGDVNRRDAKRMVLNGLIREAVARQHAAALGIKITEKDVSRQVASIRRRFATEADFLGALRSQNFSPADLRIYLSNQLLYKEIAAHLTKGQQPSEADLKNTYEQNKVGSYDTQVRVAHILICDSPNPSTRLCEPTGDDQALATELANRARSGHDFAALAKQFSKDPTNADSGGDLGYITPGQLAGEFETAAFALSEVGQVSDPVKTPFGFHVIKLLAKGKSYEQARPEILRTLRDEIEKKAYNAWIERNVAAAKVKVNPKFGRFDRVTQTVVPLQIQIPPASRAGQRPAGRRPQAPQAPQGPQAPAGAPEAPPAPAAP